MVWAKNSRLGDRPIKAIGSKRTPVTPVVSSKLYSSVCVPKLLYGCEIMKISQGSLTKLEDFHIQAAKGFQGLPDHAINCGSLATIGWLSISCIIDRMKLLFLWRLLMLPMDNIYKQVVVRRVISILHISQVDHVGPTASILDLCRKYSLLDVVVECIESGEYLTLPEWKKIVHNVTLDYDVKRWKCTAYMCRSLSMFKKEIVMFQISPWWIHCYRNMKEVRKVRNVIQLLLGKGRHDKEICKLCMYSFKDIVHILFECSMVSTYRLELWNNLVKECIPVFVSDLNKMSNVDKCRFILNALHVQYTPEWGCMYTAMLDFVHGVYSRFEIEYNTNA